MLATQPCSTAKENTSDAESKDTNEAEEEHCDIHDWSYLCLQEEEQQLGTSQHVGEPVMAQKAASTIDFLWGAALCV